MEKEKFSVGKLVFREGDSGTVAYRILSGCVEISIQENGQKLVLASLGEGEIFGEMAMIENRPRSASARVVEPTEVELINRDDFFSTLESDGERMLPLLTTIFERLRVTNDRLLAALDRLNDLEPKKRRHHHEALGFGQAELSVKIEPDSEEMSKQTVLHDQIVSHYPFMLGRRGEIAGNEAPASNQLLVADRSPYRVSRQHCFLQARPDAIYVEDTKSKLGTIVNGIHIGGSSRERRAKLSHGENTLVLGGPDSQVRFKLLVEATA